MRDIEEIKKRTVLGEALEARIDEAIDRAAAADHWPATVNTAGTSWTAVSAVIARYTEAGWRITYKRDSRDGDFVQIERP